MFSAESSRSQASQGRAEDLPPRDRARVAQELPPSNQTGVVTDRARNSQQLPPTQEQFADMQQKYASVQRQLDDLLSARSADRRAQAIEDDLELRRKAAYESAGIAYSPRPRLSLSPAGSCKWGSGLLKSRLCFLTSKNHKQDYKQRGTTTWG